MANAISAREKFQALLRELFQFDCADLDFGIYRIMNHKRAVIEEFIENDLLALVTEEIASGALAGQSEAAGGTGDGPPPGSRSIRSECDHR